MENTKSNKVEINYGIRATILMVLGTVISCSSVIPTGMIFGYSAVALPYMVQSNSVLQVTEEEGSWIASLATVATPIGCLVSGPLIDRFGRRAGLILLNIPALLGWVLIFTSSSLTQLYLGRILSGLTCGLSTVPATVYVTEISTVALRGMLTVGFVISLSMGMFVMYILGLIFQERWKTIAGISCFFPIISSVAIYFLIPESPVWLLSRGRLESAVSALKTIRGTSSVSNINLELKELNQRIHQSRSTVNASVWSSLKEFSKPEVYKPLFIMNTFFIFQKLSGMFVVVFYAVDIAREAGVTMDPFVVAALIGLTRLVVTIIAAWVSNRFGRRPTAIISGVGMSVSMLVLASHSLMQSHSISSPTSTILGGNETAIDEHQILEHEAKSHSIVPVVAILSYILTCTLGFLTLPFSMIGEIFPSRVRGIASGITTCQTYTVGFLTIKLYPLMISRLSSQGVFFFYGCMALMGSIFVITCLPETQGKSLAEIEAYFNKSKKQGSPEEEQESLENFELGKLI